MRPKPGPNFRRGSNKFGAQPTKGNWFGAEVTFHSKAECTRAAVLQLSTLDAKRPITQLRRQVPFELRVNGILVATYIADFVYFVDGILVVEDVKRYPTPEYEIKKLLMLAVYGIAIKET